MARLVESSLWVDFARERSRQSLKDLASLYICDPDACLAEPITFEVLRFANDEEANKLQAQFDTLPMLSTPVNLWSEAVDLGQRCRRHGITAGALDLLIASVAMHHDAELVTFDADFEQIAKVSTLRVTRVRRPTE